MKYSVSNTINAPLQKVGEILNDPKASTAWMEGLKKVEHLSGTPGEVGAKSEMHFLHKNKEMKLTETILEKNLPNQIKFSYQSPMGYNEVELRFEEISENTVQQTANNYFDLKGIMKLMGFFFKGMFKKQSLKYLNDFKNYAEK